MDINAFVFQEGKHKLIGLEVVHVDAICYVTSWGVGLQAGCIYNFTHPSDCENYL